MSPPKSMAPVAWAATAADLAPKAAAVPAASFMQLPPELQVDIFEHLLPDAILPRTIGCYQGPFRLINRHCLAIAGQSGRFQDILSAQRLSDYVRLPGRQVSPGERRQMAQVCSLDLKRLPVEDDLALERLTELFMLHTALSELHVGANFFTNPSLLSLLQRLPNSKAVQTFGVCASNFLAFRATDGCCADVMRFFQGMPHLTSLELLVGLVAVEPGEQPAASVLRSCLQSCPSLRQLELAENQLGAYTFRALAPQLAKLTKLRSLGLAHNALGMEGTHELARILPKLTHLTSLFLQDNGLGPVGAELLARGLGGCQKLEELNLKSNSFGRRGFDALLPVLMTLKGLNISILYSLIDNHLTLDDERFFFDHLIQLPKIAALPFYRDDMAPANWRNWLCFGRPSRRGGSWLQSAWQFLYQLRDARRKY